MRFISLLIMIATLNSTATAAGLTGVWRLIEVDSLPMQETPPYGQLNRKEVYTTDGQLLVVKPDAAFSEAAALGSYEVHENIRVFTSSAGEQLATPIQWIDDNHFFFEFNPGECWYYARVTGNKAEEQQWEPRSVAVIRTNEDGSGPTLRDFSYDATDDSTLRWDKRVLGAWETIRVAGRGVSGPDTPPYGMPNDRLLIGSDGTMRKVHANGEAEAGEEALHFKVEGNQITVLEADAIIHFWFNRWGQLIFEQDGLQTAFKRISLDSTNAAAGPFVVVLLSAEREEPTLTGGKIIEIKKTAMAAMPVTSSAKAPISKAVRPSNRTKPTFTTPFNGRSQPADLALADNNDALQHGNALNEQARLSGLGSTSDIIETNEDEKFSVIRADAIDSNFDVPFGWHVADNGDRMLVFDADHFIEVELEQHTAKAGPKALLQELLKAQRAVQPDVKAELNDNGGGSFLLIFHNFQDGQENKTRSYITHDIGQGTKIILTKITANQADMLRALNLTEALTRHLKYLP